MPFERAEIQIPVNKYECPQRLSFSPGNLFWGSFTNHNTGNYLRHGINITTNQRLSPTFRGNGNTIIVGDSQKSPLPIFPEGGGDVCTQAIRASVWSKDKGGWPPGPLPWIRYCFTRKSSKTSRGAWTRGSTTQQRFIQGGPSPPRSQPLQPFYVRIFRHRLVFKYDLVWRFDMYRDMYIFYILKLFTWFFPCHVNYIFLTFSTLLYF